MGHKFRIFEELRKWHCHRNCNFHEVEPDVESDRYNRLAEAFKDYWETVYPEEHNGVVNIGSGRLRAHEATLAHYWASGCDIKCVEYRSKIIGFLVYQIPFDGVLLVKGLYVAPKYSRFGLGKGLINSLKKPIKKLLFQTRKEVPPARLFHHIATRITKIHENQEMITWEMEWEREDGK